MSGPQQPITRETVLAWARARAQDAAAVREIVQDGFTGVAGGGWAFVEPGRVLWAAADNGSHLSIVAGAAEAGWCEAVEDFAARQRHAARDIDPASLGRPQRAALAAAVVGRSAVNDPALTPHERDFADRVLIELYRAAGDAPDETRALRVFAAHDWLLGEPDGDVRLHACPICGSPAHGGERYPRAVCDRCARRTVDSGCRTITGINTSLSGGFEARFADDGEVCDEVTASGRCWIDGHLCQIGEARFGGVVVQA